MTKISVIYYSSTGNVHALARAIGEGAEAAGAEVRLRRVPELAPREAIEANEAWRSHADEEAGEVAEATYDDVLWADGVAFGTPTRFGLPTAQLKQFLDQAGPHWAAGKLADKAVTSFTSAQNPHGGQESTILSLNNVFYHWGMVIVPPGYTDDRVFAAGGNPYGVSAPQGGVDDAVAAAARHQGERLAEVAGKIAGVPALSGANLSGDQDYTAG